jgi:hypothetical protein
MKEYETREIAIEIRLKEMRINPSKSTLKPTTKNFAGTTSIWLGSMSNIPTGLNLS